jgi:deazaflavin-dependent oxidoreductase (nitroreductase family)
MLVVDAPGCSGREEEIMPLTRTVARLNRNGLNRVMRHVAPWLPGTAVVVHRGRRSGRSYRTPVNIFRSPDGYVIGLVYGPTSDWVRNVLAAGEADLIVRRRRVHVKAPRIDHDPSRQDVGFLARPVLALLRVDDFLDLTVTSAPPGGHVNAGL